MDPILVWKFSDAPIEYKELSGHCGDEDWLAVIPSTFEEFPSWAEEGTPFGWYSVEAHKLADGRRVLIGAHS